MPEYLAPGVFVEEVSFRAKSIEGVPTSTTGFAGMAGYGPVYTPEGAANYEPRLMTSFTEYERVYGRLDRLLVEGEERLCYMALAAKAFFDNGGKRLYIARVFSPLDSEDPETSGIAFATFAAAGTTASWRARWPGRAGNVGVTCSVGRSRNIAYMHPDFGPQVRSAKAGAVVEIVPEAEINQPPTGNDPLNANNLRVIRLAADGHQEFVDDNGTDSAPGENDHVQLVELTVRVEVNDERVDEYNQLGTSTEQKKYVGRFLERDDPADENAVVWLDFDPTMAAPQDGFVAARLMQALQANSVLLDEGHDGAPMTADALNGSPADLDNAAIKATGLEALAEIDDIAIVALPDAGGLGEEVARQCADRLIAHAERERYRIAIVDAPQGSSMNEVRAFRSQFDSSYSALYHPWIEIFDPLERPSQGTPPRRLLLPPCGFVAGIYARTDIARGVHKAPANETVRGLTRFEANINTPRQEVLNPEGINALRFFEGRGYRVWGARTMSSDPEWKYVNVRRLFIFIEHSIDKSTQWAVFEPNNRRLWDNIRRAVEDFLLVLWRDGALMGEKPEHAYFVRCDRTTMTQNDIDNGRMICLVGVAPVKPAEFVIFRIGQWTSDAQNN